MRWLCGCLSTHFHPAICQLLVCRLGSSLYGLSLFQLAKGAAECESLAVELVQPTVPAMMPAMSYGVGQPADQSNPTEELERLASLHASGALSDAEFEQAKAKVLGLDGGAMPMGQPMAPMAQPMAFGAFGGLLGQGQVPIAQAV